MGSLAVFLRVALGGRGPAWAGGWLGLLLVVGGASACAGPEPPPVAREAPSRPSEGSARAVDPDRCVQACVREGLPDSQCRRFCLAGLEAQELHTSAGRPVGGATERPLAEEHAACVQGCVGGGEPRGLCVDACADGPLEAPPEPPRPPGSRGRPGLKILPPPGGGIYLGAYNYQNSGVSDFEAAVGKKVAIFPTGVGTSCRDGGTEGTLPRIDVACRERLWQQEYVSTYGIEALSRRGAFSNQDIIDGRIDVELRQVARAIADWGRPIFWFYHREPRIQFGGYGPKGDLPRGLCAMEPPPGVPERVREPTPEQLGHRCNFDQYGDPRKLDGPERYVAVARRIHDVVEGEIRAMGKDSPITWVMGGIVEHASPGFYTRHYPGESYVDWHAFDWYPWPPREYVSLSASPGWREASRLAPDKPILLMELGVSHGEGRRLEADRAAWFRAFFNDLRTNPAMRNLAALLYWQDTAAKARLSPSRPDARVWQEEIRAVPRFWHSQVKTRRVP